MDCSTSYYEAVIDEFERHLILSAWKRCSNQRQLAGDLGLNYSTLRYKLKHLGIKLQKGELVCGENQQEATPKMR